MIDDLFAAACCILLALGLIAMLPSPPVEPVAVEEPQPKRRAPVMWFEP